MDVSIVIVSWNTRDTLRDCVASIYTETRGVSFEIIVIDNASADGSPEMVKRDFPQVRLVGNVENRGFAAANNQGMAIAAGRYVLLLNSDTVVLDGAIDKTVAFADAHPRAAVVGCRVLNPDRSLQNSCFLFPSLLNMLLSATYLYKLFPENHFFGREHMTCWTGDEPRDVDVVSGCFMLVRKDAIDKVGVMDEAFFMYAEETDWCFRFKKAGWRVLFAPPASIVHIGGASAQQVASKMRLQISGSILHFLRKHRGGLVYVAGCGLTALFFAVRMPIWLFKGCISKKARPHSWATVRTYAAGFVGSLKGCRGLCVATRPGRQETIESSRPASQAQE